MYWGLERRTREYFDGVFGDALSVVSMRDCNDVNCNASAEEHSLPIVGKNAYHRHLSCRRSVHTPSARPARPTQRDPFDALEQLCQLWQVYLGFALS